MKVLFYIYPEGGRRRVFDVVTPDQIQQASLLVSGDWAVDGYYTVIPVELENRIAA